MHDLNRAVSIYLGAGRMAWPSESVFRVVQTFGPFSGLSLGLRAKALVGELGKIKPDWAKHDLSSAAEYAVDRLCARHPELNTEARSALAWTYSWWWK